MHLFLREPAINWVPPIAKITKKKSKIMTVSFSKGIALRIATTKTFKPLIEVIVLSGLITLNTLKPVRSTLGPEEAPDALGKDVFSSTSVYVASTIIVT
jgi:hypothetical protein